MIYVCYIPHICLDLVNMSVSETSRTATGTRINGTEGRTNKNITEFRQHRIVQLLVTERRWKFGIMQDPSKKGSDTRNSAE